MDETTITDSRENTSEINEAVNWLSKNSIPIASPNPEEITAELHPFKEIVSGARIVGLGEATHGNREFSQMKDKLFRFLVTEADFNGLIMEVPEEPAKKINDFVHNQEEDPEELLENLGYWITRNLEVLEMILWMKRYNHENPDNQISFFGCDVPVGDKKRESSNLRDEAMAQNCIKFLEEKGDETKLVFWGHNTHIANLNIPGFKTTGAHLKERLGENYINFATIFGSGSFLARKGDFKAETSGDIETFSLPEPQENSYARLFKEAGKPLSITDLRGIKINPLFESWNIGTQTVFEVGSVFDPQDVKIYSQTVDLPNKYDGVIWVENVTPSRLIPEKMKRSS